MAVAKGLVFGKGEVPLRRITRAHSLAVRQVRTDGDQSLTLDRPTVEPKPGIPKVVVCLAAADHVAIGEDGVLFSAWAYRVALPVDAYAPVTTHRCAARTRARRARWNARPWYRGR